MNEFKRFKARNSGNKRVSAGRGKYVLKVFITGESLYTQALIKDLLDIFPPEFKDYELEVIDVLNYPDLAEANKIIATPTVIKEYPPPVRRVIGDLSNKSKVVSGLGLPFQNAQFNGEAGQ